MPQAPPQPGSPPPAEPPTQIRERVLLAAIADIQGSIRANDGKHSAALIAHGLLFAGTLNVAVQVSRDTYAAAAPLWQVLGWAGILSAGAAFLVSVTCLLRAVAPHRPDPALEARRLAGADPPGVFLPDLAHLGSFDGEDELSVYLEQLEAH